MERPIVLLERNHNSSVRLSPHVAPDNHMLGNGDYLTVLNAGQSNQQNSNSISENAMISYLGRANYIYDDFNSVGRYYLFKFYILITYGPRKNIEIDV